MWLSNYTQSEAMHMSTHQLPWYFQPQQESTRASTTSVTWYTYHKLAHNNILQNFLFILVLLITRLITTELD